MMTYDILWRKSRLNPLPVTTRADMAGESIPPDTEEGLTILFSNGIVIAESVTLMADLGDRLYYRVVINDVDDVDLESKLNARPEILIAMRRIAFVVDEGPAVLCRDTPLADGRVADLWADPRGGAMWETEQVWPSSFGRQDALAASDDGH